MQEPKKPIGDFIIKNSKGTQTENGVYYHYTEVCRLLKLYEEQLLIHSVSNCADDLEYSLYGQVVNLKEKVKKLEFMIENGLGEEDMINDITYPSAD